MGPNARRLLAQLAPLLAATLPFASGVGGAFVLDDRPAILTNGAVNGELPVSALLTRTFWGTPLDVPPPVWRPAASLFFRIELAALGAAPLGFHLVSLALYVAVVHLAHRLFLTWLSRGAACAAACLFAAMPLHVENVSSVVGQADLLGFGFGLAALLAIQPLFVGEHVHWRRSAIGGVFYVVALLCKESAVTIPLVAAAFTAFVAPRGESEEARVRRYAPLIALAAMGGVYVGARMLLVPDTLDTSRVLDDVLANATAWQRAVFSARVTADYSRLVVFPMDLCVGRKYAEVSLPHGLDVAALAGFAIVAVAIWRTVEDFRARRAPFVLAAALMWLMFSSLVFSPPEAMADRFMLYPSFFVIGGAVRAASRVRIDPRLVGVVAVSAVLVEAALTGAYAHAWRSDEALLSAAVAACPSSVHDHYRLARVLSANGDATSAVWHYAVAAQGRNAFPEAWRHPAADEEQTLAPDERVRRMHALLKVTAPEAAWRAWLAQTLRAQQMAREADIVESVRPAP